MRGISDTQQAIVGCEDGGLKLVKDAPVSQLEPDMFMAKNVADALNPVDIKMLGRLATPGAVAGHDFAGTVLGIGSDTWTAAPIELGDRVCGAVQVEVPDMPLDLSQDYLLTVECRECTRPRRG